MLLDGEEKARIKRRSRRVWVRGWVARRQELGAVHRIVREPATEDPSSLGLGKKITYLCTSQLMNFPPLQSKPSFYVKRTTGEN